MDGILDVPVSSVDVLLASVEDDVAVGDPVVSED